MIKRNVLAVIDKNGFRVVKGVTTAGRGTPFSAIPTRRIVDFAKYGVRSAANPYIGRLNNARVRAALKATLDAFLTRMVEDEALTGYELEVTATRAQEIAGEVSVVMTLQPTFSIDFVSVTMNLQVSVGARATLLTRSTARSNAICLMMSFEPLTPCWCSASTTPARRKAPPPTSW